MKKQRKINIKQVWTTTKKNNNIIFKKIDSTFNKILWTLLITIGLIIIFSSNYFQIFQNHPTIMLIFVSLGLLTILIIGRQTNEGIKSFKFLSEARMEIQKITWPTRQETVNSTIIILIVVVLSSIIIYFIGLLFMNIIQAILS